MADKEKQIEEMSMSIAECNGTSCKNCTLKCRAYTTCEILYEKGYGNIRQTLTEFVEKLKANMFEVDTKEYGRISAVGEDAIEDLLKEFLGE